MRIKLQIAALLFAAVAHGQTLLTPTNTRDSVSGDPAYTLTGLAGTYRITYTVEGSPGEPIDLSDGSSFRLYVWGSDGHLVSSNSPSSAPEAPLASGKVKFLLTTLSAGTYRLHGVATGSTGETNENWNFTHHYLTVTSTPLAAANISVTNSVDLGTTYITNLVVITNLNDVTFEQTFSPVIGATYVTNYNTFSNDVVFTNVLIVSNYHPITQTINVTNALSVGSTSVTNYNTFTNIFNVTNANIVTLTNISSVEVTNSYVITNSFTIGETIVNNTNLFNITNNVSVAGVAVTNSFTYNEPVRWMYQEATNTASYVEMFVGGMLGTGTLNGSTLSLYFTGGGNVTQAIASINALTNTEQTITVGYPLQITSDAGNHNITLIGASGLGYGFSSFENSATYHYLGTTQGFSVGSATQIVIQAWGAAGGSVPAGAPAGYTEVMLNVTNGQYFDLTVPQGGDYNAGGTTQQLAAVFGGGGRAAVGSGAVGSGGGAAIVWCGTNLVLVAGGAGGGTGIIIGSPGGGLSGGSAVTATTGGQGGTQTNGGVAATSGGTNRINLIYTNTAGSMLLGGNGGISNAANLASAAGGGGGYYGGGGGYAGGAGGGGSGYVNSNYVVYGTTVRGAAASGQNPPAYESPWYPTGYSPAIGTGAGSSRGGHGAIVIRYP